MQLGTSIEELGLATDALAPEIFVVPRHMAVPDAVRLERLKREQPDITAALTHPLGVRRLTGVRITVADPHGLTQATRLLTDNGVARIEQGCAPLLELTLDGGVRRATKDLRPTLLRLVRS